MPDELASWEAFVLVVKNFLGNQGAENYAELVFFRITRTKPGKLINSRP